MPPLLPLIVCVIVVALLVSAAWGMGRFFDRQQARDDRRFVAQLRELGVEESTITDMLSGAYRPKRRKE